jgi:2-keto-3-deoxy-L-rhamnonate aldolase RhmA
MLVMLQIESVRAVSAVEEIAAVEGIDCLFIGLTDLSVDLGYPGLYDHRAVEEQVERILSAAVARGLVVGVPVANAAMAQSYAARGVRILAGGDIGLFAAGVTNFVREVRPSGV